MKEVSVMDTGPIYLLSEGDFSSLPAGYFVPELSCLSRDAIVQDSLIYFEEKESGYYVPLSGFYLGIPVRGQSLEEWIYTIMFLSPRKVV